MRKQEWCIIGQFFISYNKLKKLVGFCVKFTSSFRQAGTKYLQIAGHMWPLLLHQGHSVSLTINFGVHKKSKKDQSDLCVDIRS